MKVLVINNYSMKKFLRMIDQGMCPAHHCWGCDKLRENGIKLRFALYKVHPILLRFHLGRVSYYILQLYFLVKAIGCNSVYVAASPLIDLMGFLKYLGIYRKKLVMVVHHPRNFSMRHQRYDKIIFICKEAYEMALFDYPQFKEIFVFQEWGPDLNFYASKRANLSEISFVSNGITSRDNVTLVEASKRIIYKTGILCNQQSIPYNYDAKYKNIKLVYNEGTMMNGKVMSYPDMINFVKEYAVCVIPTKKSQKSLCGLTSFCDAIALGMPVILSKTTHIYVDFSRYNFGLYYTAEDVDDLEKCMNILASNKEQLQKMGETSRKYAEIHDYQRFADAVLSAILG